jgi:23S rRNA pseudouridine955/2504/2580 synthase
VTEPQPGAESHGVRQIEVDLDTAGTRLDQFLIRLLSGVPRSKVFRIVRKGEVRVNGKRAGPEQRLQERDIVRVPPVRLEPAPAPGDPPRVPSRVRDTVEAAIISEDDRLLVLDKPAGVAVHGGSGLSFGVIETLRASRPKEDLELVHRLDRDTSGCLLVARRRSALRTLHELMRENLVEKRYLTLVKGHWNLGHTKVTHRLRTDTRVSGERTVKVSDSGKEAISEFRPIQWFGNQATLLEVSLHTGRTHQIRVHAAHSGHPVAGDEKYGDDEFNAEMKAMGLNRMFLHAHSVSFEWPQGAHGGLFSASAPLPTELAGVIDALSGPGVKTASRPPRWNSKEGGAPRERKKKRAPSERRNEGAPGARRKEGGSSERWKESTSAARRNDSAPGERRQASSTSAPRNASAPRAGTAGAKRSRPGVRKEAKPGGRRGARQQRTIRQGGR